MEEFSKTNWKQVGFTFLAALGGALVAGAILYGLWYMTSGKKMIAAINNPKQPSIPPQAASKPKPTATVSQQVAQTTEAPAERGFKRPTKVIEEPSVELIDDEEDEDINDRFMETSFKHQGKRWPPEDKFEEGDE